MIIDGKKLADEIKANAAREIGVIKKAGGQINFVVVRVGANPASLLYIEKKQKACEQAGVCFREISLDENTTQSELNKTLTELSEDRKVNGILLQMPLAKHLDTREAIGHIAPLKDVDGLTAENFGRLATEEQGLEPCTARGVLHILKSAKINLCGADACIIGRSNIVGKPTALMLSRENATVTICHKKTKDLLKYTKSADIIVVAAGSPRLLTGNMVKQGAAIIDVGINRLPNGKVVGDVEFESVSRMAGVITPVPGGVGPLTIAFLLDNIVQSYKLQMEVKSV